MASGFDSFAPQIQESTDPLEKFYVSGPAEDGYAKRGLSFLLPSSHLFLFNSFSLFICQLSLTNISLSVSPASSSLNYDLRLQTAEFSLLQFLAVVIAPFEVPTTLSHHCQQWEKP